jgi:hypothetical protein
MHYIMVLVTGVRGEGNCFCEIEFSGEVWNLNMVNIVLV